MLTLNPARQSRTATCNLSTKSASTPQPRKTIKILTELAGRRTILKTGLHLNYTKILSSYVTENTMRQLERQND